MHIIPYDHLCWHLVKVPIVVKGPDLNTILSIVLLCDNPYGLPYIYIYIYILITVQMVNTYPSLRIVTPFQKKITTTKILMLNQNSPS